MGREREIRNIWQDVFLYFKQGVTGPLVLSEVGENERIIGELTEEEQIILAATEHLDHRGTPLLNDEEMNDNDRLFLQKINEALNDLIFTSIIYRLKDEIVSAGSGRIAFRKGGKIVVANQEKKRMIHRSKFWTLSCKLPKKNKAE